MFLSFYSLGLKAAIASLIFFGIFIFLIFPVLKNQVVEVKSNCIVLYSFGKGFDLGSEDLFEVVDRGKGIFSYRFEKGTFHFQISPRSYYDGEVLENHLKKIFSAQSIKLKKQAAGVKIDVA